MMQITPSLIAGAVNVHLSGDTVDAEELRLVAAAFLV